MKRRDSTLSARQKLISQTALKEANLQRILAYVKSRGETIKSELSHDLNISFSTVSALCSILEKHHLITQVQGDTSSGGRKPARILFNPEAGRLLAVDISHEREAHVSLLNLDCTLAAKRTLRIDTVSTPDELIEMTAAAAAGLDAALGPAPGGIIGGCAAVPGVFDAKRETMISSTNPLLLHVKLKERFERAFGCPFRIENDSNMAALGELISSGPHLENLLLLYFSTGIGLGIVIDRDIYRGTTGFAGELGHLKVTDRPIPCSCGQSGCFEAVISADRFLRELGPNLPERKKESGSKEQLLFDLLSRAEDERTEALLEEFAVILGRTAGFLIDLFNPDALALGGEMEPLLRRIFKRMRVEAARCSTVLQETDARIYIVQDICRLIAAGCGETAYSSWLSRIQLLDI